ncbi:origin recognition complex subunit 4 C-terminus-domain-containing protein, partial [Lipomyces oligophaga]|uniref:origin recognition complex subunit 4 C-terminus-domain-containing protein n=1 Tax=Lipomyces oligophaga TaxID=45792 RepID=UPI0034CE349B
MNWLSQKFSNNISKNSSKSTGSTLDQDGQGQERGDEDQDQSEVPAEEKDEKENDDDDDELSMMKGSGSGIARNEFNQRLEMLSGLKVAEPAIQSAAGPEAEPEDDDIEIKRHDAIDENGDDYHISDSQDDPNLGSKSTTLKRKASEIDSFNQEQEHSIRPTISFSNEDLTADLAPSELALIKRQVLAQLNGRSMHSIEGNEEAYGKLFHLLEYTILAPTQAMPASSARNAIHGGNSALLLGPRGSGKTLLISSVIDVLRRKYRGQFITVRLSGLAQTDDKLALHEIARQLERGRKEIEDDGDESGAVSGGAAGVSGGGQRSYHRKSANQTLNRLVTMLSGRSGLDESVEQAGTDGGEDSEGVEDDENSVVSIIIILEEFERFATMQNRQTLLYNLLDAAQSPRYSATSKSSTKAPSMCVVGVSNRMTAVEMLEKRVRSRFSHRVLVLRRPHDERSFWKVVSRALKVEDRRRDEITASGVSPSAVARWNSQMDRLISDDRISPMIERTFDLSGDPRLAHVDLILRIRQLRSSPAVVEGESEAEPKQKPEPQPEPEPEDSRLVKAGGGASERVEGLSEMGQMLLVSAARAEEKYATVNFAVAYDEYVELSSQARTDGAAAGAAVMPFRVWSREQAAEIWEGLERADLVVDPNAATGGGPLGASWLGSSGIGGSGAGGGGTGGGTAGG